MNVTNSFKTILARFALGLCLVPMLEATSHAAYGYNLTVTQIALDDSGTAAFVLVTGTVGDKCTAPGSETSGFAFDYSTAKGQAILQLLTAAQLSGKRLTVFGNTTCTTLSRPGAPSVVVDSISYMTIS